MSDEATTFSRSDFYEYIWSTPLAVQNRDYRLTELRLAALCAKHEVPCPPRGFWKKHPARAQRPARPPLPPISKEETRDEITLKRSYRFGRPLGRKAPKIGPKIVSKPPRLLAPISVPTTLPVNPHELTKRLVIALDALDADENGLLHMQDAPVSIHVSERLIERAIILIDALLRSLEDRGYLIGDGKLVRDGAPFTFDLREAEAMSPHIVSDEEAAEHRANQWLVGRFPKAERLPPPQFDFTPTGRLLLDVNVLDFAAPNTVLRARQWSDGEGYRVEERLPIIIDTMREAALEWHGLRQAAEAIRRKREEVMNQWKLEELDGELRAERRDYLRRAADAFHDIGRLSALAVHLERQIQSADGIALASLRQELSEMIADAMATWSVEALRAKWDEFDHDADRRRQRILGS